MIQYVTMNTDVHAVATRISCPETPYILRSTFSCFLRQLSIEHAKQDVYAAASLGCHLVAGCIGGATMGLRCNSCCTHLRLSFPILLSTVPRCVILIDCFSASLLTCEVVRSNVPTVRWGLHQREEGRVGPRQRGG